MAQNSSPIQLYCTVKKGELEKTGNSLHCSRCQKHLQEITPGSLTPTSGCGFIRKSAIPVIASSLVLSSCVDPQLPPDPTRSPRHDTEKKEEIIVPGMICPPDPDKKPLNKADYPTAARVVGRPKWITSPYTGRHVDVEGLPAGSLAIDPTSKVEDKKYFVIPPDVD